MYILEINRKYEESLGTIRHWTHLKMAVDGDKFWIKELSQTEAESVTVKSIPFVKIFKLKDQKLIPYHSTVPVKKLPGTLLWTPIERGLPITFSNYNHNYFGIDQTIKMSVIPSLEEREGFALVLKQEDLGKYLEKAPLIRLKKLKWLLFSNGKVLLFGTPLLPVPGDTFWLFENFLLPAGFEFNLPFLSNVIYKKLNPQEDSYVLWNLDNSYMLLKKEELVPLSISSWRLTSKLM